MIELAKEKERGKIMDIKRRKKIILKVVFIAILFLLKLNCTEVKAFEGIPRVYFEGDISNMTEKTDERQIKLKFNSSEINFETNAEIKIQGTSSLGYEKKNYNITLYKDDNYEDKEKVDVGQGWGEQSKYCLKANWIDKTHSRNIVSARITAKIQNKYGLFTNTPNNGVINGFPIEIYSNNEFLGLYTWNIPKADWLWGLDEDDPNNIALVGDDWTEEVAFKKEITTFDEAKWEVEIGEENQDTIDKFNRVINFVNNSSDEEYVRDFEQYLNKDATLNYIVMVYAMKGSDNLGKNMIMVTYDGKVWYPSLYDLDSTWGTLSDGSLSENYDYIPDDAKNKLITRTIQCFSNDLAKRWFELREDILTKDNILAEFNNFINSIPQESYQKEEERWGEIPGYGIDQIEEFLDYRLEYIDNLMIEKLDNIDNKEINNDDINNNNYNEYYKDLKTYIISVIVIVMIVIIIKYIIVKNNKNEK